MRNAHTDPDVQQGQRILAGYITVLIIEMPYSSNSSP